MIKNYHPYHMTYLILIWEKTIKIFWIDYKTTHVVIKKLSTTTKMWYEKHIATAYLWSWYEYINHWSVSIGAETQL